MRPSLAPLLLLTCLVPAARADTLKVPSAAYPTIQSAIDVAQAADTVVIAAGSYAESLTISADQDGLHLIGRGRVFLDVIATAGTGSEGVVITADGVSLTNLTIRHATEMAVRAVPPESAGSGSLQGITLTGVDVIGPGFDGGGGGFELMADDAVVSRCRVLGANRAISIQGDRGRVLRSSVVGGAGRGLDIVGDDALVDGCLVERLRSGNAIEVLGAGARVLRNRVRWIERAGIVVSGADLGVIERNQVRGTGECGLQAGGPGLVVQRNRVEDCGDAGMDLLGDGLQVLGNRVQGAGLGLRVEGQLVLVQRNSVEGARGGGLVAVVDDSTVRGNSVTGCGTAVDSGLAVHGSDNRITANRSVANTATGIQVSGSGSSVERNVASGNVDNGLLVSGAGHTLERNVIGGNHGDGLTVEWGSATLRGNRMTGNLQDLSIGQPEQVTDGGGNVFQTGGFASPPVVTST